MKANLKKIKKTAEVIRGGGVAAYPTDTCYGLGADPFNSSALEKLLKVKRRPRKKSFSWIFEDIKMIQKYCKVLPWQKEYLSKYLPGPYTFILKSLDDKTTIGVRIPDCATTKALIKKIKKPFTTTSANISGQEPCYNVECLKKLKGLDFILDDGSLPQNPPSNVIDLTKKPARVVRG